jgi:hypothetical protein
MDTQDDRTCSLNVICINKLDLDEMRIADAFVICERKYDVTLLKNLLALDYFINENGKN